MTVATVVVPVRNDARRLGCCLDSLLSQSTPLEIIVVDDGSTDGSAAAAQARGVKVLHCGGEGPAAARNEGIAAANGEFVLFTDADCRPVTRWAEHLLCAFSPGVVASKGCYCTEQGSATARFVQLEYELRYERMSRALHVDFLDTYSLAVRREDLIEIGGFDEGFGRDGHGNRFVRCSDQEMSFRLASRGDYRFVPEAVVCHEHASTVGAYVRKKFAIARGKCVVLKRHPRRARGDSHTPGALKWQLALLLTGLLFGGAAVAGAVSPWPVVAALAGMLLLDHWILVRGVRRFGIGFGVLAILLSGLRCGALATGLLSGMIRPPASLGEEIHSRLRVQSRQREGEQCVLDPTTHR